MSARTRLGLERGSVGSAARAPRADVFAADLLDLGLLERLRRESASKASGFGLEVATGGADRERSASASSLSSCEQVDQSLLKPIVDAELIERERMGLAKNSSSCRREGAVNESPVPGIGDLIDESLALQSDQRLARRPFGDAEKLGERGGGVAIAVAATQVVQRL